MFHLIKLDDNYHHMDQLQCQQKPFKDIWVGVLAVSLATFFVEICQIAANMYISPYINTLNVIPGGGVNNFSWADFRGGVT